MYVHMYICIHVFTIIHVDTFHGSKGDFPASCVVTSLKIRNHYIVANLTSVVLSAEDCCISSMKLWVLKKIVLFNVYFSIILTFFILSTLFDKDYTRILYIYIYIHATHCLFLYSLGKWENTYQLKSPYSDIFDKVMLV